VIEDIILTIANIGFVTADLKQAYKLFKNKRYNCNAFSKTHFKVKLFSLSMVIIAYTSLGVYIALTIAIFQWLINIYIYKRIQKGVKKCHTKDH